MTFLLENLLNKVALYLFSFLVWYRGYKFIRASSENQLKVAAEIKKESYEESYYIIPEYIQQRLDQYDQTSVTFICYYQKTPIGTITLFDPQKANRLYDGLGVNQNANFYELGNLAVKKDYRGGDKFVVIGLFKQVYEYSRKRGIEKWIMTAAKNSFITLRKFSSHMEVIPIDFNIARDSIMRHYFELFWNKNPSVCFTASVTSFSPWYMVKKMMKRMMKQNLQIEF